MRVVASAWKDGYVSNLASLEFWRGLVAQTVFWLPRLRVRFVVWGDGFLCRVKDLRDVIESMSAW